MTQDCNQFPVEGQGSPLAGLTRYCQVGFIRRRPVYRVDGRPLDICLALREHGCAGPNHDIDVKPTRIGMGPTVHLNVVCTKARGVPLDSFQALAPCLYKDHEPTDPASREGPFCCLSVVQRRNRWSDRRKGSPRRKDGNFSTLCVMQMLAGEW